MQRDRNRPAASMHINPGQRGVDMNQNIGSRSYTNLPVRTARGSFENAGFQPNSDRIDQNVNLNQQQTVYQQAAQNMMSARNSNNYF